MRRALTALLVLALAPAAAAAGQDSLLSGYGGPGDGEQALLGQTLILEDSGSAPASSPAAAATPAPSAQELYAPDRPAETAAPATSAPAGNTTAGRRPSGRGAKNPAPAAKPTPATNPATTPTAAPVAVAASSAPATVSGRDIALALAVLLVLTGLALCARRLAVRAARARRPSPA